MKVRVLENTWERIGSITQRHGEKGLPEVVVLLLLLLPVLPRPALNESGAVCGTKSKFRRI